jgi:hypothetical protein
VASGGGRELFVALACSLSPVADAFFFSFPDIVCLYTVVARDDVCFIY